MLQNRFLESLQNIPGRGRLGGGITRCSKLSHKRKCFKVWKKGGDIDAYQAAKRASNLAIHIAKTDAEKIAFKKINPRSVEIYRLAKQMRRENQDIIGDKPVRNNNGRMPLDVDSKKEAWRKHYMHLFNVEFSWNPGGLSEVYPVECPSKPITTAMVRKAINKMSLGKTAGPLRPQIQVVLV